MNFKLKFCNCCGKLLDCLSEDSTPDNIYFFKCSDCGLSYELKFQMNGKRALTIYTYK